MTADSFSGSLKWKYSGVCRRGEANKRWLAQGNSFISFRTYSRGDEQYLSNNSFVIWTRWHPRDNTSSDSLLRRKASGRNHSSRKHTMCDACVWIRRKRYLDARKYIPDKKQSYVVIFKDHQDITRHFSNRSSLLFSIERQWPRSSLLTIRRVVTCSRGLLFAPL